MSVCTFIAANYPLSAVAPPQNYPFEININTREIFDGGADDNYFLHIFKEVDRYTNKKYGVWLEWDYTEGRAKKIIEYLKNILKNTDQVEFWHVWLMDYYEYEDRPVIHKWSISIDDLTTDDIKVFDTAAIWNSPDKTNPDRPSYYCLIINR